MKTHRILEVTDMDGDIITLIVNVKTEEFRIEKAKDGCTNEPLPIDQLIKLAKQKEVYEETDLEYCDMDLYAVCASSWDEDDEEFFITELDEACAVYYENNTNESYDLYCKRIAA